MHKMQRKNQENIYKLCQRGVETKNVEKHHEFKLMNSKHAMNPNGEKRHIYII